MAKRHSSKEATSLRGCASRTMPTIVASPSAIVQMSLLQAALSTYNPLSMTVIHTGSPVDLC